MICLFEISNQKKSAFEFENATQAWKFEEKLSQKQRRSRYRCGNKFKTQSDCPPWSQDIEASSKKGNIDDHDDLFYFIFL
jgi:hypothetical protein